MNTVIHIWDILVKSNTFNFIVMLFILGWIVKKFAIKDSLEGLKNSVINSIEKAKEEKENAKDDRSKDSQWMNAYKKAAIIGLAIAIAVIILLKGLSKVKEHLAK